MKKRISIISILLSLIMLVAAFPSCGNTPPTETDSQSNAKTEEMTESVSESDTDTNGPAEVETEMLLIPEGEDGELIALSNKLANTADTYYSENSVVFKNSQMSLTYNTSGADNKLYVSKLTNNNGNSYITDTMDVFVTMKNGNTFYASDSAYQPSLNIYRYGYYYYENRLEGFSFMGEIEKLNDTRVNHLTYDKYNGLSDAPSKSGGTLSYTIEGSDPWVSFGAGFSTSKYDYLEITMRAVDTESNAQLFIIAGSHTYFTQEQMVSFGLIADGEFHTYYIPLNEIPDYTNNVRGLRLDVNGPAGAQVEISGMRAFKADLGGAPINLTLQRSFLNYSDKLHHILQIAAKEKTEDILEIGMLTEIDSSTVSALVVKDKNGIKTTLDGVDWSSAEYVGFDIKNAGIFGYILPYDANDKLIVTLENGIYRIIQTRAPQNNSILPSEAKTQNANDFFMGQRIYTDNNHSFDKFLYEAHCERNPLSSDNITIDQTASDNASFKGYDSLRGYYKFTLSGTDFNQAYYNYPNKHFAVKFTVTGDDYNRNTYFMTFTSSGNLESAALLNADDMLIPVPLEVAKNFNGDGENTIYNLDDMSYGEVFFPMIIPANAEKQYTVLNLYQNWGQYPLKQISSIQFSIPYYHLSTGVTETNCIVPLPTNGPGLPDHRAMSAPFWKNQPQHNSGGTHNFLRYTDKDGVYAGTNNVNATIDSYGPTYCDLTLDYISSDGRISVSYTHTEMPQTDENRAYYEMKYTVLEDISFEDFAHNFSFYVVTDNNPKGSYKKVGYLDKDNKCQVATAISSSAEEQSFVLGDQCPYFSFFDMPDYDPNYTGAEGYTNLSFLIYNSEFVIGGEKATPSFLIRNTNNNLILTLDLDKVTLKKGDSIIINAILMPWGSQESDYSGAEPDFNVREVRRNTLLNPLTVKAEENCSIIESVFVPKIRSTDGKTATFTLSGGENNVSFRVYGFDKLTVPYIEEYVDGKWVEYNISSISTPDAYGIGHCYDGYMVHYDGDGTYSYSFVTEMKNGNARKFRVSADKDFEGWPEVEETVKAPDPINVYLDPQELMQLAIGQTLIGRAEMAEDSSYVRFYGKAGVAEGYMSVFNASNPEYEALTSTGQYFIFKYRMPEGISNNLNSFEFFTSTVNSGAVAGDNMVLPEVKQDNEWHIIVIDISKRLSAFKPNAEGEYLAKYFRFDIFNGSVSADMYIDFAYMGLSDSLDDIYKINSDAESLLLVSGSEYISIDPKTGETLDN